MSKPFVFVSYCQKDAAYRDELVAEVLAPYKQKGFLDYWYDQNLEPGQVHEQEIFANLEKANVTIFLVSSAFVSSWFIQNEELPKVLEAHRQGRMKIFWLLLKPLDLALVEDLKAIQAVENPSKPLSGLTDNERYEVWSKLGTQLRKLSPVTAPITAEAELVVPQAPPEPRRPAIDRRRADAISVEHGFLEKAVADAVIVSASREFRGEAGMEKAIHQAAGPNLRQALRGQPPLEVTAAVATPAFGLPARTLVHARSPEWRGNARTDLALLHQAYDRAFGEAIASGARSIALGSLGAGHKGFPADVVAGVAVDAARRAIARGPEDLTIRFVVQKAQVQQALKDALEA